MLREISTTQQKSRWLAYAEVARGRLLVLFICRLLAAIAFFGSTPFLVLRLSEDVGFSLSSATLLVGILTLVTRTLAVPAGALADRVGHMRTITGSALLLSGALFALGLTTHPGMAVFALALYSMGAAAQYVAFNSAIPHLAAPAHLPIAFGLMGSMFNLGAICGPALSGVFISRHAYGEALIVAGVASALSSPLALFAQRREGSASTTTTTPEAKRKFQDSTGQPRFLVVSVIVLFISTWGLLQQLILGLSAYTKYRFASPASAAVFFTAQAFLALLAVPLAAAFMTAWSLRQKFLSYAAGTALLPVAFLAFASVPSRAATFGIGLLIVLISLSEALAAPTVGPLIAQIVPRQRHGSVFGTLGLAQAVGMGVGSLLSASALAWAGPTSNYYPLTWAIVAGVFALPILGATYMGLRSMPGDAIHPSKLQRETR